MAKNKKLSKEETLQLIAKKEMQSKELEKQLSALIPLQGKAKCDLPEFKLIRTKQQNLYNSIQRLKHSLLLVKGKPPKIEITYFSGDAFCGPVGCGSDYVNDLITGVECLALNIEPQCDGTNEEELIHEIRCDIRRIKASNIKKFKYVFRETGERSEHFSKPRIIDISTVLTILENGIEQLRDRISTPEVKKKQKPLTVSKVQSPGITIKPKKNRFVISDEKYQIPRKSTKKQSPKQLSAKDLKMSTEYISPKKKK